MRATTDQTEVTTSHCLPHSLSPSLTHSVFDSLSFILSPSISLTLSLSCTPLHNVFAACSCSPQGTLFHGQQRLSSFSIIFCTCHRFLSCHHSRINYRNFKIMASSSCNYASLFYLTISPPFTTSISRRPVGDTSRDGVCR